MADEDDKDLFQKTMEANGVRRSIFSPDKCPLGGSRNSANIRPQKAKPPVEESTHLSPPSLPANAIDQTNDGPLVLFARRGVDKHTLKRLRQGSLHIDESLDLHGMRSHGATISLNGFLVESLEHKLCCIQIIHGKGTGSDQPGGVLKPLTIHWLKQQPEVLAFCSAIPHQGGSGATNVLLSSYKS